MNRQLLTVEQAAELVQVSVRTIRRWRADGLLVPILWRGQKAWFLDSDVYRAEARARARNTHPDVAQ